MKIIVINSRASYYIGGAEVVSLMEARFLASMGHDVVFVTSRQSAHSDPFEQFKNHSNVTIEYATTPPYRGMDIEPGLDWSRWNIEAAAFGLACQDVFSRHADADIVVTHMSTESLFVPHTFKNVLHLHGSPRQDDMLIKTSMARPDYCLSVSTSVQEWWHKHYPDVPMEVFRNGIDTGYYKGAPSDERSIDVLYAGRFLPHKGIADMLMAVDPTMRVAVAGHGPEEANLRQIAQDRNLDVTFYISPTNDELRDLYKIAKIFVCVSSAKEGVLTTMLEAAASGCAVITAHGSGMTDIARHEVNALIVQPGDTMAITQYCRTLIESDEYRSKLALALQQEIIESWSWKSKVERLSKIYESVIAS